MTRRTVNAEEAEIRACGTPSGKPHEPVLLHAYCGKCGAVISVDAILHSLQDLLRARGLAGQADNESTVPASLAVREWRRDIQRRIAALEESVRGYLDRPAFYELTIRPAAPPSPSRSHEPREGHSQGTGTR